MLLGHINAMIQQIDAKVVVLCTGVAAEGNELTAGTEQIRCVGILTALSGGQKKITVGSSLCFPFDGPGLDMEQALQALEEVDGKTASDEIVSEIFSHFCVGK
jgi:tRNA U34 5-carboxymethylaminomethyl modifying GTPase MnmE/TrmE